MLIAAYGICFNILFSDCSTLHRFICCTSSEEPRGLQIIFSLLVIAVSCCAPVMGPDRREDLGEMYSPDDQGEYTSLDEAPHFSLQGSPMHWWTLGKELERP